MPVSCDGDPDQDTDTKVQKNLTIVDGGLT